MTHCKRKRGRLVYDQSEYDKKIFTRRLRNIYERQNRYNDISHSDCSTFILLPVRLMSPNPKKLLQNLFKYLLTHSTFANVKILRIDPSQVDVYLLRSLPKYFSHKASSNNGNYAVKVGVCVCFNSLITRRKFLLLLL